MIFLIFIPIFTALSIFLLKKKWVNQVSVLAIFIEALIVYQLFIKVNTEGPQTLIIGGFSKIIGICLYLDYWSFVFLGISLVAWIGSSIYALSKWSNDYKFNFFLHFLRGTFYGLIFSNDLFNVFVFIEIISVISAVLIIYKKDGFSIRAGMYYLLFNSVGTLFYLMGLIIIYMKLGTLNIEFIYGVPFDSSMRLALGMIITSLGVKSAFFPVYTWTWLPRAHMAAPSSISALLSGVLVKTGFIVLFKFFRFLPDGFAYKYLMVMGVLKAISGILFALSQKDIKGILAFHTISQSGIILMGISGVGKVRIGGLLHLVNHSFFKGLLFLTVGIIIRHYKKRRIKRIRGLLKTFPVLSIALIIGILSITGFPFSNGFYSKYLIKTAFKGNAYLMLVMHLINLGTVVSFVKLSQVLFGEPKAELTFEKIPSRLALLVVASMTAISGILEKLWLEKYMQIEVHVHLSDFITYGIYVLIGVVAYRTVIKQDIKPLKYLRHYQLGFRRANILLIVFLILSIVFI